MFYPPHTLVWSAHKVCYHCVFDKACNSDCPDDKMRAEGVKLHCVRCHLHLLLHPELKVQLEEDKKVWVANWAWDYVMPPQIHPCSHAGIPCSWWEISLWHLNVFIFALSPAKLKRSPLALFILYPCSCVLCNLLSSRNNFSPSLWQSFGSQANFSASLSARALHRLTN